MHLSASVNPVHTSNTHQKATYPTITLQYPHKSCPKFQQWHAPKWLSLPMHTSSPRNKTKVHQIPTNPQKMGVAAFIIYSKPAKYSHTRYFLFPAEEFSGHGGDMEVDVPSQMTQVVPGVLAWLCLI